ncbi:hypothetical protein A2572_03455, partial [Candidatus Collierbacteria bacterium RIFOXYD1_FULL_40_9]
MIPGKTKAEEELLTKAGNLFQEKKFESAEKILHQIIKQFPNSPEGFYNLGLVFGEKKLYPKAIAAYKKAAKLLPTFELAHLNLGVTYVRNNQLDLGIKTFEGMVKKNQDNHDALFNLGLALVKKNQLQKAQNIFRQAIFLNPSYSHSYFQTGSLLSSLGKLETASHFLKRAIELSPTFAPAYASLGTVLANLGQIPEATTTLEKAIELGTDQESVVETLYSLSRKSCDWEKAKTYSQILDQISSRELDITSTTIEPLFSNLERVDDPKINLKIAKYVSGIIQNYVNKIKKEYTPHISHQPHQRLRLGYLSHDLHDHPVTSQIKDLFRYHDKTKFEIFVYSYGVNDQSQLRKNIETNVEHFIDLFDVDHQQIADQIRSDEIDILIDLVGYTGFHRQDILAYRPAPIQINYLGFPASTGANFVDYTIADKIVIPPSEKKYYTEKVLYMPNCYQLCSHQKVSKQKFIRKDFGLPENFFIFGSFNRHSKIDQQTFNVWINILKKVPNSVLWLYCNQEIAKQNLRKYFTASGLLSSRLIFASKMPLDKHLSRLRLVDLALDTNIYSGG